MADGEAELRERASEAREADGRRRGWRTLRIWRPKHSVPLYAPRALAVPGMSGVGAAILEPQEHAQSESVRVYLSQSILPAITEALTAMEKERCPNPVPHAFAALLSLTSTCAAQSRTTSYLACEQARGAS